MTLPFQKAVNSVVQVCSLGEMLWQVQHTSTSRHQHKHIFASKRCIDRLSLIGSECLGAEVSFQHVLHLGAPLEGFVPALVHQTIMLVAGHKPFWLARHAHAQVRVWLCHAHVFSGSGIWGIVCKAASAPLRMGP